FRASSVSSMRSTNVPPSRRAMAQLYSAVRAPPTWKKPVGDGANRRRGGTCAGAVMAPPTLPLVHRRQPEVPQLSERDREVGEIEHLGPADLGEHLERPRQRTFVGGDPRIGRAAGASDHGAR